MLKMKKVLAVTLAATTILGTSLTAFATTEAASSSSASSASTEEAAPVVASSTVAGVKSTVSGTNLATVVTGTAVTTPADTLAAGLGLAANEKAYAKISNFDAKKSTAAKAVVDAVVAAIPNAKLGPVVNFELGKMAGGKYTALAENTGSVAVSFGVPAGFAKGAANMAVIKVTTTGVAILPDLDSNPNTVTIAATAGPGVYAIIKY